MIRLGKLTDYGLVLMTRIARHSDGPVHSTRDLALESGLPLPTVTKLLKELHRSGLLVSHRGTHGGYHLARDASSISVAEIVSALEGAIALTECDAEQGLCAIEPSCPIKLNLHIISLAVRRALESVMLSDLAHQLPEASLSNSPRQTMINMELTSKSLL